MFHNRRLPDPRRHLGTLVSENSGLVRPGVAALKWGAPSLFERLILLALVCAGSIVANANAAVATPWEKLPDGRVVIQVKDVQLAFSADEADANDILFTDRHEIRNRMSLKEIIAEPDLARKFFSGASLLYVNIPNLIDRKGLYLGKFPRSDFRSFSASLVVGEGATIGCEGAAARLTQLRASLAPHDPRIKETGWAEFETTKHPLRLSVRLIMISFDFKLLRVAV
jgi:hypothetical protein